MAAHALGVIGELAFHLRDIAHEDPRMAQKGVRRGRQLKPLGDPTK
ncbi:MAG: hypothetical protein ABR878_12075 [Roseiarcus sp.]